MLSRLIRIYYFFFRQRICDDEKMSPIGMVLSEYHPRLHAKALVGMPKQKPVPSVIYIDASNTPIRRELRKPRI